MDELKEISLKLFNEFLKVNKLDETLEVFNKEFVEKNPDVDLSKCRFKKRLEIADYLNLIGELKSEYKKKLKGELSVETLLELLIRKYLFECCNKTISEKAGKILLIENKEEQKQEIKVLNNIKLPEKKEKYVSKMVNLPEDKNIISCRSNLKITPLDEVFKDDNSIIKVLFAERQFRGFPYTWYQSFSSAAFVADSIRYCKEHHIDRYDDEAWKKYLEKIDYSDDNVNPFVIQKPIIEDPQTWGIWQRSGGPCGVIASIQCKALQYMFPEIFVDTNINHEDSNENLLATHSTQTLRIKKSYSFAESILKAIADTYALIMLSHLTTSQFKALKAKVADNEQIVTKLEDGNYKVSILNSNEDFKDILLDQKVKIDNELLYLHLVVPKTIEELDEISTINTNYTYSQTTRFCMVKNSDKFLDYKIDFSETILYGLKNCSTIDSLFMILSDAITYKLMNFTVPFDKNNNGDMKLINYYMINPTAICTFVVSCILTRTPKKIFEQDFDENSSTGSFSLLTMKNNCSQELVNLFLTGFATASVHDGTKDFANFVLIGNKNINRIVSKTPGFITIQEYNGYLTVGDMYKYGGRVPAWVCFNEAHYTVLFAYPADSNVDVWMKLRREYLKGSQTKKRGYETLDLVYYDQLDEMPDFIRLTMKAAYNRKDIFDQYSECESFVDNLIKTFILCDGEIDWNGLDPYL